MTLATTTLPNGLKVVSHDMPALETVSLGVWIAVGSRHERDTEHGLAHFLEHMAFKGTATRSARDIAEEIERVGGDLNASTGLESTGYYARTLKADMPLALELIADILLHPRFDPAEVRKEREVILQELAASLDSPEDVVFDLIQEVAYPNQPVGRNILGDERSLRRVRAESLSAFLTERYRVGDMVLAAAGAVDHGTLVAEAERRFGGMQPATNPRPEPAHYRGGTRRSARTYEQTHIVVAFEGLSFTDPDYYALQAFSSLLGGGMSSRLFQEARERRGLCYGIDSFAWGLEDGGLFGVNAATGPDRATTLLRVIHGELRRAADRGILPDELVRAKAQLKVGLATCLESSSARADQLARHMHIYGRPLSLEEMIGSIAEVTVERVSAIAGKLLEGRGSLATAGPIRDPAKFDAEAAKLGMTARAAA